MEFLEPPSPQSDWYCLGKNTKSNYLSGVREINLSAITLKSKQPIANPESPVYPWLNGLRLIGKRLSQVIANNTLSPPAPAPLTWPPRHLLTGGIGCMARSDLLIYFSQLLLLFVYLSA